MTSKNNLIKFVQWKWQINANSNEKIGEPTWKCYSDVANIIIEEAFQDDRTYALLDNYTINFKNKTHIFNCDQDKQYPIERVELDVNDYSVREERFIFTSIDPKQPFAGQYGWISPFIRAAARYLNIERRCMPAKDPRVIPMIVEKAANGIIEEGIKNGEKREAEKIADLLREKKHATMKEVWERCAYLYSLGSFLCKKLNEIMRLIGEEEYQQEWKIKARTLGPFCLLLWDNPSCEKTTKKGTMLYRGASLSDELILLFKEASVKKDKPIHSFQSFTSCTRDFAVAEAFSSNVLFIMTIKHVFSMNLKTVSKYPQEEEELVCPGVCFTVKRVKFDENMNKHLIYLDLIQQYTQADRNQIFDSVDYRAAYHDRYFNLHHDFHYRGDVHYDARRYGFDIDW